MAAGAYRALLADADSLRRGDLDGRCNLSEQALVAWTDYVLDICQYPSPRHGRPVEEMPRGEFKACWARQMRRMRDT